MSGRKGKSQTILKAKKAECEKAVQPQQLVAPKRSYCPHTLKPSIIRRICHLPPEKCNSSTQAKVMYLNRRFGKCSLAVCHEDICPYTEVCKEHKKIPKPTIEIMEQINRFLKKSAKNSAMPKSKLNKPISKNATKTPRTPGGNILRYQSK